jgi:hypothetical protein
MSVSFSSARIGMLSTGKQPDILTEKTYQNLNLATL